MGVTGGAKEKTLTQAQIPTFSGGISQAYSSAGRLLEGAYGIIKRRGTATSVNQPNYATSGNQPGASIGFDIEFGGGQAHDVMNPYMVVNYEVVCG